MCSRSHQQPSHFYVHSLSPWPHLIFLWNPPRRYDAGQLRLILWFNCWNHNPWNSSASQFENGVERSICRFGVFSFCCGRLSLQAQPGAHRQQKTWSVVLSWNQRHPQTNKRSRWHTNGRGIPSQFGREMHDREAIWTLLLRRWDWEWYSHWEK